MQANNKSDAEQVYNQAIKVAKIGIKDSLKYSYKYFLKPFSLFSYHYFLEGIKAVQKDGSTKELEKLTNLSYDETIKTMEKCQKDDVRVVASERKLKADDDDEFGKKKSLAQQKRITRYNRRIKRLYHFKMLHPRISTILQLDKIIKKSAKSQNKQVEQHKDKVYNIYFNKSKAPYMADRIADIIAYRTGISKELFDENTQAAIEEIKEEGMNLNSQQLRKLSDKFKFHEIGSVNVKDFKRDYCVHEIAFSTFLKMENELEISDIPYRC